MRGVGSFRDARLDRAGPRARCRDHDARTLAALSEISPRERGPVVPRRDRALATADRTRYGSLAETYLQSRVTAIKAKEWEMLQRDSFNVDVVAKPQFTGIGR